MGDPHRIFSIKRIILDCHDSILDSGIDISIFLNVDIYPVDIYAMGTIVTMSIVNFTWAQRNP